MIDENTLENENTSMIPIPSRYISVDVEKPADQSIAHRNLEAEALQEVKSKLVEKMPALASDLFDAWTRALAANDSKVMRDVAEAIGVLQPKTGINILNQVNNNNSNVSSGGAGVVSIESIIKKMEAEKRSREDSTIIDAEIIEDDGTR